MRIGLYGLPSAGKTCILNRIDFMEVAAGSRLLCQYMLDFHAQGEEKRAHARKHLAEAMMSKPELIMDGHYAFGDEIAFTEQDGQLYDAFLYLYIAPEVLRRRMACSDRNRKYLRYDIEMWQAFEMECLRSYCHTHQRDFYVLDNPPGNVFDDVTEPVRFIRAVREGYSCLSFARQCAGEILRGATGDTIVLLDGDRTLTVEDTSEKVLHYKTDLFRGNFYTGYQAWRQGNDFQAIPCPDIESISVGLNGKILRQIRGSAYILTSGHERIWRYLSERLGIHCFCGPEMAAETKLFITQALQRAGKRVIAYGDSMNDYYMLMQADEGYLVARPDGRISKSLNGREIGGLKIV